MRRAGCLAVVAILCGCASLTPAPAPSLETAPAVRDRPFTVAGRLSARSAKDAVSAHFRWQHAPPRDEVELASPLGQTVAALSGDTAAGWVKVRLADGRTAQAGDWTALTERMLGFPLPVTGLAAWIRGGPHAGSPRQVERDEAGRIALLRQDGWEIVYDYADREATRPARLRLTYPDVEVRLVIDRWE